MIEISNTPASGKLDRFVAGIQSLLDMYAGYPYLKVLAIILAGMLLAWLLTFIATGVLGLFVRSTRFHWDDKIVAALRGPLFWSIALASVLLAMLAVELPVAINKAGHSVIITLYILLWTGFVLRLVRIILHSMSAHARPHSLVRPQTRPLFENLGFIVVIAMSMYFLFQAWHIDMTAWLASAGIIGIAVGFAAKDTLANLFSGVFILADAPYKIGDYVLLDSGERGKITHIGIRSTRMLTRDDVEVTVPNAIMGNSKIINESGGPYEKYRIRVAVSVAYGSDIDQVREVLMQIADEEEGVCEEPEPRVRFRNFGASGLDFELLCWIDTPELRGRVLDSLNSHVYKQFMTAGIEIPYSKHDLYIKQMPGK